MSHSFTRKYLFFIACQGVNGKFILSWRATATGWLAGYLLSKTIEVKLKKESVDFSQQL